MRPPACVCPRTDATKCDEIRNNTKQPPPHTKGNRAEQSRRLNLLCGIQAMDNYVLVMRAHGVTEWVSLSVIDDEPERYVEVRENVFHALW